MEEKVCLGRRVDIRIALMGDADVVLSLVDSYILDGGWIEIDGDLAKKSLKQIIKMNGVLLGECDGELIGGMAGYVMPGLFMKDTYFSTLFFYIKKSYRNLTRSFMVEVEKKLKFAGITKVVYGVPKTFDHPALSRFFKIMGYDLLESHYCKEIQ